MLVYFTIVLVALLGFCGMAIDVGRIELRTTQLQAAADDGALTAAAEAQRQNAYYASAAATEVASYLSQAGLPSATTTAQSPSAGPYMTDLSTVQVTVTQQIPLFFMGLVTGSRTRTLTAKAVGMVPPCAFLNSYSGAPSNFYPITLQSASLRGNCPVYANSGIHVDYFSSLGNYQAKTTGPPSRSGEVSGNFFSSPLIYNSPVLADPLAYVTAPVFSACTYTGKSYTATATISPGTYCGGTTINGASVTMNPGLYIITGGMQIINSATLSGSGVTMYFTQGGSSSYGSFRLLNSTMRVNAPTDSAAGGIPGVVLFGDRNWPAGQYDFQFSNSTYQGDGIVYTMNAGLSVSGGSMSGYNYFGIDSVGIYQYGSYVAPSCNYSSLPGGNPFHIAASLVQ